MDSASPLIFIDANVFLNLYGTSDQEDVAALMQKVTEQRGRIIVGEHLAMEVLTHRQQKFGI